MTVIERVSSREACFLELELSGGHRISVNLETKLPTARFSSLRDRHLFEKVSTDGHMVIWGEYLSMTLDEVLEIVRTCG